MPTNLQNFFDGANLGRRVYARFNADPWHLHSVQGSALYGDPRDADHANLRTIIGAHPLPY